MKSNITEGCSTFSFEQLDEFIKIDTNYEIISTDNIDIKSNKDKSIVINQNVEDKVDPKFEESDNSIIDQPTSSTYFTEIVNTHEQIWDTVNHNFILDDISDKKSIENINDESSTLSDEKILISISESLKNITEQLQIIINKISK
jgi:hypothetical protein